MFVTSQELYIGVGLAITIAGLVVLKNQKTPSLDKIKNHLDKADAYYDKHVTAKADAADAADAHIAAKVDEIAGLSEAIGAAQSSIAEAKRLTATEPPTPSPQGYAVKDF